MATTNGQISHTTHAVAVLVVPFPLQGHLNQLLHLSRLISTLHVPVHYAATAAHNRQARRRIHGWGPNNNNNDIVFHQLPPLSHPSPAPNPGGPTHFPSHLQPLIDAAASGLRGPIREIIRRLCAENRRVAIVHDSLMGSAVRNFVEFGNAEAYTFHSVSAYTIFFFLWENLGRPFEVGGEISKDLPSLDGCFSPEFTEFVRAQHEYVKLSSGRVYNTCRVVEGPFMELLERPEISGGKKQWALGPFNPVNTKMELPGSCSGPRHGCLKWLDGQRPNSVILVSFGTTTTLSGEQITELAMGLEKSEHSFIWVLRDADRGGFRDVNATKVIGILPEGFEERVRERGIVVRDWAPQLEVLGHAAVGGFMSHCGWNSCMESISMGVPIAAWPIHSDQPRNAILVTRILKIGIVVKDWARRREIMRCSEIESGVRRLMASEEGATVRRWAAELGGAVREAVANGGSTRLEWDSFISHITR